MDTDFGLMIFFVSILILAPIVGMSLRGYWLLKDRNIGLISLAFLIFLIEAVFSLTWVMGASFNLDFIGSYFLSMLDTIAILLIIYAFYKNKNFNQAIKRWHLLVLALIIVAAIVAVFTIFMSSDTSGNAEDYLYFVTGVVGGIVLRVLMLFLLVVMFHYFLKTRNTNTLLITVGFGSMLLSVIGAGYRIAMVFTTHLFDLSAPTMSGQLVRAVLLIMSFLPFLIVLLRTRGGHV